MNFYDNLFIPFINNYLAENESSKNIDILKKRYGIDNPRIYTLEEIGLKYSVSRERIRQIESDILRRIRILLYGDDLPLLNLIADNELVNTVDKYNKYITSCKAFNIIAFRKLIFEDNDCNIGSYVVWEHLLLDLIKVVKYRMKALDNEVIISSELNIKEFKSDLEYAHKYMKKNLIPSTIDDLLIGILKKRKNRDKAYILLAISCLPLYKKSIDGIEYVTLEIDDSFSAGDLAYRVLWIKNEPLTTKEISREINSIIISKGDDKLKHNRNIVNQMGTNKKIIPIGNNKWALKEWNISKKHINQLIKEVLIKKNGPMSKKEIVGAVKIIRTDIKNTTIYAYLSYTDYYQLDDGKVILTDWKRKYSDRIVKRKVHKNYNELFIDAFRYYSKKTLTTSEIWDYVKLEFSGDIHVLRNNLLRKDKFILHKKLDGNDYWTLFDNYISIVNQLHGNKKNYIRSVAIDIIRDNDGGMFLSDLVVQILLEVDCNDRTVYQVLGEKGVFTKTVLDQSSYVSLVNNKQSSHIKLIKVSEMEFEGFLKTSKSEEAMFDYKQGFIDLSPKRKFDDNSFIKIMKNVCAMANHGVGKTGRVFIGITDKENDTKRIESLDNIKAIRFNDFGVVGIEREAIILGKDLEKYQNVLLEKIEKSHLDEKLKTHLKSNLGFIQYKGKYVLMIEVSCIDGPSIYNNNELYIRNGPNLQLVDPKSKEFHEVYRRCF